MSTDTGVPDNPYASPATVDADGRVVAKRRSLSLSACVGLFLVLVAYELIVVFSCLVPRPRIGPNLILFVAEFGPFCAAIYCGWQCGRRSGAIPLIIGNFIAWLTFTLAVRILHQWKLTSINIAHSDVLAFTAIAFGSVFLLLFVAWMAELKANASYRLLPSTADRD